MCVPRRFVLFLFSSHAYTTATSIEAARGREVFGLRPKFTSLFLFKLTRMPWNLKIASQFSRNSVKQTKSVGKFPGSPPTPWISFKLIQKIRLGPPFLRLAAG